MIGIAGRQTLETVDANWARDRGLTCRNTVCIKSDRDSGDSRFSDILKPVVVRVVPDEVADLVPGRSCDRRVDTEVDPTVTQDCVADDHVTTAMTEGRGAAVVVVVEVVVRIGPDRVGLTGVELARTVRTDHPCRGLDAQLVIVVVGHIGEGIDTCSVGRGASKELTSVVQTDLDRSNTHLVDIPQTIVVGIVPYLVADCPICEHAEVDPGICGLFRDGRIDDDGAGAMSERRRASVVVVVGIVVRVGSGRIGLTDFEFAGAVRVQVTRWVHDAHLIIVVVRQVGEREEPGAVRGARL